MNNVYEGLNAYKTYLAIRNHFNTDYDYFKYKEKRKEKKKKKRKNKILENENVGKNNKKKLDLKNLLNFFNSIIR